jgi:hypothetical protein
MVWIWAPSFVQGQPLQEQSASYVSQIDEDLTIRRVSVLPVIDNVDGIYARPIETQLIQLVRSAHRWDYVDSNLAGSLPSLIELEEQPSEVQRIARSIEADALIGAAASKGPNGLSIRISLFVKKDGKLIAQEILRDHPRFQLAEVRDQVRQLYARTVAKLPYEGLILSRQVNRVTINLGRSDGLIKDQVVTVVQIIGATRHPRFNFLVSTEKEIIGRVKILKVDDTLSFGAIISEKERGAIRRLSKISGLTQVTYPVPTGLSEESGVTDFATMPDGPVSFGKEPREWLPVNPPSFGQAGMKLGFGSFSSSLNMDAGTFEARSPFYPSLAVHGEIWLNPEWIVRADLMQGVISTANPRDGSQPEQLNYSMSRYSLELGYNFLLRDDFFGPKVHVSAGFATYRMFVDDSQPTSLTTVEYSGAMLGLGGSFPITEKKKWYLGGRLNLYLMPRFNESPVTSGAEAKSTINDFTLFGEHKFAENLKLTASIDFSLYSTNFSGIGNRTDSGGNPETATSLSHRHNLLTAGLIYMF